MQSDPSLTARPVPELNDAAGVSRHRSRWLASRARPNSMSASDRICEVFDVAARSDVRAAWIVSERPNPLAAFHPHAALDGMELRLTSDGDDGLVAFDVKLPVVIGMRARTHRLHRTKLGEGQHLHLGRRVFQHVRSW